VSFLLFFLPFFSSSPAESKWWNGFHMSCTNTGDELRRQGEKGKARTGCVFLLGYFWFWFWFCFAFLILSPPSYHCIRSRPSIFLVAINSSSSSSIIIVFRAFVSRKFEKLVPLPLPSTTSPPLSCEANHHCLARTAFHPSISHTPTVIMHACHPDLPCPGHSDPDHDCPSPDSLLPCS